MDPGLGLGPQGKALGGIAGEPAVLHAALGPVGTDLHPLDVAILVVDRDEIPAVSGKGPNPVSAPGRAPVSEADFCGSPKGSANPTDRNKHRGAGAEEPTLRVILQVEAF